MTEKKREMALQAIAKDPNRLIKTNPIINAKFDITSIQMKVFLKVIAALDQSQEDMPEVRISVKEFQQFMGGKSKNIYLHLQDELSKLRKKDIYYEDEYTKLEASFFSSIEYKKKEGYFEFEFSKKLKPFLLQIKENFTVLDIRNIQYLDSIYAIRFYELCKEYERIKTFEIDIDSLKERFGLTKKYKNYFDFKLKVIQQAREELVEKSELHFDFEEIKVGKRVVRLKFIIISNPNTLSYESTEENDSQNQVGYIYNLVKSFVDKATVSKWFEKFPYEQIEYGVSYTLQQHTSNTINDVAKYLQKMVSLPINSNNRTPIVLDRVTEDENLHQKQNQFKKEYYEIKQKLAYEILVADPVLYQQILTKLELENEKPNKNFLIELAYQKYKIVDDTDTHKNFLYNFKEETLFQSYVLEVITDFHKQMKELRKDYIEKGAFLGLKEKDIF